MFDLGALMILTIFNLIALAQVVSAALAPNKLQTLQAGGMVMLCLSVSLMGLGLVMLIPSPGMSIAMMSVAALVNLLAALGPSVRYLSEPRAVQLEHAMNGMLHFAQRDTSPVLVRVIPRSPAAKPDPLRSARATAHTAVRVIAGLLPRPASASASDARPPQPPASGPRLLPGARPGPALIGLPTLTPRQTYTVPRRPNRLPTSSLAFLLSVDPVKMPDIFAEARASMARLPALARRVRLVAIHPRRPLFSPHNEGILPSSFTAPDPAWQTTYGRFAALIRSA